MTQAAWFAARLLYEHGFAGSDGPASLFEKGGVLLKARSASAAKTKTAKNLQAPLSAPLP